MPNKYDNNKFLSPITDYNTETYPLSYYGFGYDIENDKAYKCMEHNGIEYIMVTDEFTATEHTISAFKSLNCSKIRIGYALYITGKNGFALKHYGVHPHYRKEGIGGNILDSIILSEYMHLKRKYIYVHASTGEAHENSLNQSDLEHHYEKHGIVLCDNCYYGAEKGIKPKRYVKKNLHRKIRELTN